MILYCCLSSAHCVVSLISACALKVPFVSFASLAVLYLYFHIKKNQLFALYSFQTQNAFKSSSLYFYRDIFSNWMRFSGFTLSRNVQSRILYLISQPYKVKGTCRNRCLKLSALIKRAKDFKKLCTSYFPFPRCKVLKSQMFLIDTIARWKLVKNTCTIVKWS